MTKGGRASGAEIIMDLLVRQNQQQRFPDRHGLGALVAVERGGPEILKLTHGDKAGALVGLETTFARRAASLLFGDLHLIHQAENDPVKHLEGSHGGVDIVPFHR